MKKLKSTFIFILCAIAGSIITDGQAFASVPTELITYSSAQASVSPTPTYFYAPYAGMKILKIYSNGVDWHGAYYQTAILKNGTWQPYVHGAGYDGNYTSADNVTAVAFKRDSTSGSCYITYTVVFASFVPDDTEVSNINIDTDAIKLSADAAKANTVYNGQSAAYWAYQAAQNASPPPVFKVIKDVPFSEALYGEISGTSGGVRAVTTAGSGYTTIEGALSTIGIQKITLGSKILLFKVIAPPSSTYTASVSFGS